jgi:hypothetical protein
LDSRSKCVDFAGWRIFSDFHHGVEGIFGAEVNGCRVRLPIHERLKDSDRLKAFTSRLGAVMKKKRLTYCCLIASLCFQAAIPQRTAGENPVIVALRQLAPRQGHPPEMSQDDAIEELASNIDWLEHEIDHWGSIVPKIPDVWGEARLTQHRYEIENELSKRVGDFKVSINAAQSVRDQAFLAAALSMNSKKDSVTSSPATPSATAIIANAGATAREGNQDRATEGVKVEINGGKLESIFGFEDKTLTVGEGIKLEQTAELDQMKRYLDHLNELRRVNDGDDISDAPGYSLNLVRIPISLIPGTKSQEGYGAEITITATPEFGPETLPVAFKDFVINDVTDQLAIPLTRYLNDSPIEARKMLVSFLDV